MASEPAAQDTLALEARKTGLLRSMLAVSQQGVLLVDLDGLAALLEEKERLIGAMRRLDEALAGRTETGPGIAAEREEQGRLLAIVLEHERQVEQRMDGERQRLKSELRELERETRLRRYLERPSSRRMKVDLKQ